MLEPDLKFYGGVLVLSSFVLAYGLSSNFVKERLFLSEALISMCIGVLISCTGLDWLGIASLSPVGLNRFFLHFSRLVLVVQVMAAGISLPQAYIKRQWKSIVILVGPVMLSTCLVTSTLVYLFYWDLFSWVREAMLIGSILSPTDPVLANSILKGLFAETHVPLYLRTLISAESGANDGSALPLIFMFLLLLLDTVNESSWSLAQHMFFDVILQKLIGGILVGLAIGIISRKALYHAESKHLIDKESFVAFEFALSLMTASLAIIIGCSDLIAVFATGIAFSWDGWFEATKLGAEFQNVIDALFSLTFFILLGVSSPWKMFVLNFGLLKLTILALLVLVLRRIPSVVFFSPWIAQLKTPKEALFVGWFGPMGVGAIFYATYSSLLGCNPKILALVWFIVLASIVAHGITVPLFHMTTITRTFSLLPPDEDEAAELLTTLLSTSERSDLDTLSSLNETFQNVILDISAR